MPSTPFERALPRVVAIVVASDGAAWLPAVLRSLESQDYPDLRVIAVDNGSKDNSREILTESLPSDAVVAFNRSTGFGRAINAALRHEAAADAECLLFVHDDLALEPVAVSRLVTALTADETLGMVGPKLREWTTKPLLQEVGMTVDRFGRAETRVERGELDQGHLDGQQESLYVSTAGMLVRAELFKELEGFDVRFPALRDDLDLCWRAWLLGWKVEVVSDAVGYHVAAGSRGVRRLWRDRPWQARFLSERHALAALLKNYSLASLAWILPLTVALGLLKLVGFAMTRRFSHMGATLRAYVWNVVQLRATLQRRRVVQRSRRRSDTDLKRLFASGLPRVRDYADALREWLAGSNAPAILADHDTAVAPVGRSRLLRTARERPAIVVGGLLGVVYLAGIVFFLAPGQLYGGDVLPWPDSPRAFFDVYASPAAGEPLATGVTASPFQAVLGTIGMALFGSAWLSQRVVVFGLLPLAWLTALRAGRLVTSLKGPRVVGATLYVLSPVVLGTLVQGRLGELVVAALLPALVLLTAHVSNGRAARGRAWKATAWLALITAVAVSAAPGLALVIVPILLVGLGVAVISAGGQPGRPVLRMLTAIAGAFALLTPWLTSLFGSPGISADTVGAQPMAAWRALTLVPETFPTLTVTGPWLTAAVTVAIVLLAMLLGIRLRPLPVASLAGVLVLSAAIAYGADRLQTDWVWTPALLLPGAAAVAGLGVLATRTMGPALRGHTFGLHQLAVLVALVPVVVGVVATASIVVTGPWTFERDLELVPPYVSAEADRVGPYRILMIDERDGEVTWAVTDADGPSMRSFGTVQSSAGERALDSAVSGVLAGDLDAGGHLGLVNVRYVVVSADSGQMRDGLATQPEIEPMVAGGGRVFLVRSWLPRAAVLPADVAERILESGTAGSLAPYEDDGFERVGAGQYRGLRSDAGVLLVSEEAGSWEATAAGTRLERLSAPAGVPVSAFAYDEREGAAQIEAQPVGQAGRNVALIFQALVFLGLVSLLLRPPGFAQESGERLVGDAVQLPMGTRTEAPELPLEARLQSVDTTMQMEPER